MSRQSTNASLDALNAPAPTTSSTSSQSLDSLHEQLRNALGREAHMLAALEDGYRRLQLQRSIEADSPQAQRDLNQYLLSPQKTSLPTAIFFGHLNGDQVYIFLHRIVGALPFTMPFTLAYHAFDPYNDAHRSQHTCDDIYAKIESKSKAFEHAKDPSQVHALALYYFARSEKIMNLHPFVEDVAPHLLTVCRNALGAQDEKIKFQAKQEAQRQIITERSDAPRKRKRNGPSSSLPTSSLSRNAYQSSQNIDGPRSLDGAPATSSSEQVTWMRDRAEILSEKISKVYNEIDDWKTTLREQNLVKMQAVDALMPLIKQIDTAEERMKFVEKKLENLEKEKDDVVDTYLQALGEIQKEER